MTKDERIAAAADELTRDEPSELTPDNATRVFTPPHGDPLMPRTAGDRAC